MSVFLSIGNGVSGSTPILAPFATNVRLGQWLFLEVVSKYPPNTPTAPTTPGVGGGVWTLGHQGVGGAGAAGPDTGQVYVTVYYKIADAADVAASVAASTMSVTITGANSSTARMSQYARIDPTSTPDLVWLDAEDSSADTTYAVTTAPLHLAMGDLLIAFTGVSSDGDGAGSSALSHTFAASGIAFTPPIERHDTINSTGDDTAIWQADAGVYEGSTPGTVAVTYTVPIDNALQTGCTVFLRIRERAPLATDGPNNWKFPIHSLDFDDLGIVTPIWNFSFQTPALPSITPPASWPVFTDLAANGLGVAGSSSALTLYQQTVPGFTRKAAVIPTDGNVMTWRSSQPTMRSEAAGARSLAIVGAIEFTALPSTSRDVLALNGGRLNADPTHGLWAELETDGRLTIVCCTVRTSGTYNYVDGAVHMIAFWVNHTLGQVFIQTDKELITGVYDSGITDPAGLGKGFGGITSSGPTAAMRVLWGCADRLSGAERDWRAFMVALGVSFPIVVDGIPSNFAIGTPTVYKPVVVDGISSNLAIGTPTLYKQIMIGGIASQLAIGTPTVEVIRAAKSQYVATAVASAVGS